MNKNVLIIGGSGFIGTQLTKAHLNEDDNVSILDNESNSLTISPQILDDQFFGRYYKNNVEEINTHLNIEEFDLIYHLASESRPLKFHDRYASIISANVVGIQEILKYIRTDARLVYASTSEIYGDSRSDKLMEYEPAIINPQYPRNVYALSKLLGESILQNRTEVDWVVTRLFNSYGPENRADDTKVIPVIIDCLKNKKPFPLCGIGEQVRSFTYVDDTVRGLMAAAEHGIKNGTYNIGSDFYHTINELLEILKLKVYKQGARLGEPVIRRADIQKSFDILGYKAEITLKQGLKKIFKYHHF